MSEQRFHDNEFPVDIGLVRRLIAAQFPEWSGLPITFVSSSGTVNLVYRLGEGLCVRPPRIERYGKDIERELKWLPHLSPRLSLATPVPVGKGEPGEGYPCTWAVYRWLPGVGFDPEKAGHLPETGERLAR